MKKKLKKEEASIDVNIHEVVEDGDDQFLIACDYLADRLN